MRLSQYTVDLLDELCRADYESRQFTDRALGYGWWPYAIGGKVVWL